MASTTHEICFDGIHCNLVIERPSSRVVLMKISGTDVGEFGDALRRALDDWISGLLTVELFIDARDVRGASIEVSGDWAGWWNRHKLLLGSVTMLTGSLHTNHRRVRAPLCEPGRQHAYL